MKLPVELLSKSEAEYQKSGAEMRAIRAHIASTSAMTLDGPEHFERRRAMIAATAVENVSDAFERYIGTNDLLPINYLLSGYLQASAVGRVRYFDKRVGKTASATGFMVSPDLMMTNHHVFPVANLADFERLVDDPTIEFGYEYDLDGRRGEPIIHSLDPAVFLHTFEALDLALVAVHPTDRSNRRQLQERGYLVLNGQLGKAGLGDFATIIQHPEGRDKQIALRNNEIIDTSLPDVLIYKSDTAQGSSGAPVFNNEWQAIALHSAGVPKKNAAGQYIDKDDQIIVPENGKVDGERIVWLSNRGVRVSAIMTHLRSAVSDVSLHPMVQVLLSPAYTDSRPFASLSRPTLTIKELVGGTTPATGSASPAAAPVVPINISISIGGDGRPVVTTGRGTPPRAGVDATADEEKLFEDEQDFSTCEGFQNEFMDVRIPMPVPTAALRKKLAFRTDSPSSFILKYHHYSTFQHAVRRVPVVSGINIDGKHRYAALGKDSRKDKWYRDNRIDYDAQLDDAWYAKSGFDKGHMARREDAEWGATMAAAKRAADMTCSYANAIPQVPALNRAIFGFHGMWGQLEGKLLEAGVENEAGKSARICVFNGPIFAADDPVYKSVQVALSCFKIVVWYDGTGQLRTTCFTLSQKDLVGEVDFEVLHFDEVFTTSQHPLAEIEAATGLTFHGRLRQSDTSGGAVVPVNEVMLERLVRAGR
jgi:endonuclease G